MQVRPSSELRALVAAGTPLALASLGQTLAGTLAVAVAGRLGEQELGAVGLGSSLYFTVAVFGVGVLLGVDPLLSQALGRGDVARARRGLGQGLWLALGSFLVLGLVLAGAALCLGSTSLGPATVSSVRDYLWGRLPGLAPYLGFVVLRSYAAALGRTRHVLTAVAAASLCVLGVAPALASAWGVLGIGLSESLGALVQLVVLAWCVRGHQLARGVARAPCADELAGVLRVGAPVGLSMVAEYAVFACVNVLVALVEPGALGAHQVAITWLGTLFMLPVGFGGAAAARVGRALGRGETESARQAGLVALGIALGFGAALSIPFFAAPRVLASWLTSDAHAISVALPLMGIAGLVLVADSAQAVLVGAVRGAGDTRYALFASLGAHFGLGLPVGVGLATWGGLGAAGLWLGLGVGLAGVACLLALRFIRVVAPLGAERCEPSRKSSSPARWPGQACSPHPSLGPAAPRLHP